MSKMKRRANNEGTVRQRPDGRWEARFSTGLDPSSGKTNMRSVYGKTREEVSAKLLEARAQLANDDYIEPSALTVGEWLKRWLELYVKDFRKPNTILTYQKTVEMYIAPSIGAVKLQKLTRENIQRFVNEIAQRLSPASVKLISVVLKAALDKAVANDLIRRNVATNIEKPSVRNEKTTTLSASDISAVVSVLPSTTHGRIIAFIAATGLRVGEACALCWSDVVGDAFTVHKSVSWLKMPGAEHSEPIFGAPKSATSVRTIPLSKRTKRILDEQRKAQATERIQAGSAWVDYGLVFASQIGLPLQRPTVERALKQALNAANLPDSFSPHDLRHAWATAAMASGCDAKMVASLLGHSNVTITLDRYTHPDMDSKRRLMESLF